ncbi:MAG: hypothetical protein ACRCXB_11485 [Aeromonadaceae bacterium]
MKYFIKQMILGKTIALPLDEVQFETLKISQNILSSAMAIEEKYDLLVSNFLELEKELLTQVAQQMIFSQNSYNESHDIISIFNRRVINLLTSTKLYYDQIEKHVRTCQHGCESSGNLAKYYFSEEYDNHQEYRFMEALRNHVQHYGLAVHSLSLPSRWIGEGDGKQIINTIRLFSLKDKLKENEKFKKSVFKEIEEKTDLVRATRVYVGSFSNVHDKIRKLIEGNVTAARECIQNMINIYKDSNNGDAIGIYAYSIKSDTSSEQIVEKFSVILDWDDVRIRLKNKNMPFPNISKWYVSGSLGV